MRKNQPLNGYFCRKFCGFLNRFLRPCKRRAIEVTAGAAPMTMVLATQAGLADVIMAADSLGQSAQGPLLVRKLFVRNACGIATFGAGMGVPETIETRLPASARLTEARQFMTQEFRSQPGVHALVAGLDNGDPQIWHIHNGQQHRLASPLGEPNYLYFNEGDQIRRVVPNASEDHGIIIAHMLGLLRQRTDNQYIGPPFSVLLVGGA
jgi:hypothetical protein